jgi:hypothetical protein
MHEFEDFKDRDIEKILTITAHAKQTGKHELPDTDAIHIDENEENIIRFFEEKVQKANDIVYTELENCSKMMTNISDALSKVESIKRIHHTFKNKYKFAASKNINEMHIKADALELAKKDLRNFKIEHRITRQEKSAKNPLINWALVFAIVFFESILNASFFAQGSSMGLLGGIIQAFIIVMINVLVANLIVLLIRRRNLNNIKIVKKTGYTLLIGVGLTGLMLFHFLVGHYRDALKVSFEDAYALSVLNFSSNPFHLIDFESYILVVMGSLFFILLVLDFYHIKDPYPGYAEVSEVYDNLKNEYDELKFDVLDDEEKINQEINEEINNISDDIKVVHREAQNMHIIKSKLENKYSQHISNIIHSLNTAISSYRFKNEDFRTTPIPAYFKNKVEFEPKLVEFIYNDDNNKIELLERSVNALPEIIIEAQDRINDVKEQVENEIKIGTV